MRGRDFKQILSCSLERFKLAGATFFQDGPERPAIELEPDMRDEKHMGSNMEIRIHEEVEHESGFVCIEVYRLEADDIYPYR